MAKTLKVSRDPPWVMKIFKEGIRLQDLQRLLPSALLADASTRSFGQFNAGFSCNSILGAMLVNRRFALVMERKWGDLWKLIDARMIRNHMHGQPFPGGDSTQLMQEISQGTKALHERNIIHGDLKAANVLVLVEPTWKNVGHSADVHLEVSQFWLQVADYECLVRVMGAGFWRATEILQAVKNRDIRRKLFAIASD